MGLEVGLKQAESGDPLSLKEVIHVLSVDKVGPNQAIQDGYPQAVVPKARNGIPLDKLFKCLEPGPFPVGPDRRTVGSGQAQTSKFQTPAFAEKHSAGWKGKRLAS